MNFDDASSLELLTRLASTRALKAVTFDGAVRSPGLNVRAEMLKGIVTPAGGEVLKIHDLFLAN
ncbi:MAG: hypothetical protein O2856_11450 [Planctomycetota bacterium]|nr:hypothetical protein [Planctomycetota bacterium]